VAEIAEIAKVISFPAHLVNHDARGDETLYRQVARAQELFTQPLNFP
jgi:hypothetical protein